MPSTPDMADGRVSRIGIAPPKIGAKANWSKIRNFLTRRVDMTVGSRYKVGRRLASGAFGQVRLGHDLQTGEEVAVKLEPASGGSSKCSLLQIEYGMYKKMGAVVGSRKIPVGIPTIYQFGTCKATGDKFYALVMELLGTNLEEAFLLCNKKFSYYSIAMIGLQILNRLETLHSFGLVHRDVKPENCVLSLKDSSLIYLVDLGLARSIRDSMGKHIPYSESRSLIGTVRYMSINAHRGLEQTRRDDLESLAHLLFYLLSGGRLPWQRVCRVEKQAGEKSDGELDDWMDAAAGGGIRKSGLSTVDKLWRE